MVDNPPVAESAGNDPHETEAQRLESLKDWPAARVHAQHWTEAEPKSARAWQFLARAQRELGEYNEAARGFQRASELDPGSFWIAANFGSLYYLMRDFERAETQYRRAIAIEPQHADAYSWLAHDLVVQDRGKEAIAAWEEAARRDPNNFERWNELAYQQYRQGNMKQAAEAADRSVALNPNNGYGRGLADWARTH
jgi:tetratricopeptide (TPR) repeat protein